MFQQHHLSIHMKEIKFSIFEKISALIFTVIIVFPGAKICKECKWLLMDTLVQKMRDLSVVEYYSVFKRGEYYPLQQWMKLDSTMLVEISQTKTNYCMVSHVKSKK